MLLDKGSVQFPYETDLSPVEWFKLLKSAQRNSNTDQPKKYRPTKTNTDQPKKVQTKTNTDQLDQSNEKKLPTSPDFLFCWED